MTFLVKKFSTLETKKEKIKKKGQYAVADIPFSFSF
jgi:hypothetical protein